MVRCSYVLPLALLLGLGAAGLGCGSDAPVAGGSCTTSSDCITGETCVAGTCTAGSGPSADCVDDLDCPTGTLCNLSTGTCEAPSTGRDLGTTMSDAGETSSDAEVGDVPGDAGVGADAEPMDAFEGPCTTDEQCGTPPVNICFANQCVLGCGQPNGLTCTGGQVCNTANGRCEAAQQSCATDAECPSAQICESQLCVPGCTLNPSLCDAATQLCDPSTFRCVALPTPCTMDSECMPPMTVCESSQCVPGCDQTGGIQCSGTTPYCNSGTGRCQATQVGGCTLDSDCGATEICENMQCVPRCDAPTGSCTAPQVCNPTSGRCINGGLALGATCSLNAQCTTNTCLGVTINSATVRTCSQPCGAQADCPLNFSCSDFSGMSFCIAETVFTPAADFDTRAGGYCDTNTNTCQSGWCNTGDSVCLETCQRSSHCSSFGGQCYLHTYTPSSGGTGYQQLCYSVSGSAGGVSCTTNSDCRSGVCNRYAGTCADHCCADSDCASNQNCGVYDLDTSNIVKVCTAAGSGTRSLGSSCTSAAQCATEVCAPTDPTATSSPMQCSTTCCSNADCAALPNGGTCQPLSGPVTGTLVGVCIPN